VQDRFPRQASGLTVGVRAVVVSRTGGPEVLEVVERPDPVAGPGEVVVDVEAAGVNFIDVYHREGRYPRELPFVLGSEGAGTVRGTGERVAWAVVPGAGYADTAVVPADRLVPVPDGVPTQDAAAVLLQGMTALFLAEVASPGDTAVVHAAAGGVGLLLVQLLAQAGVRVVATTSTPEKAELARGAGAADVVPYEEVVDRVREVTGGRGAQAVYDGVGRTTFDSSLACAARRGSVVLFGASSGPVPPLDPLVLMSRGSLWLTRPTLGDFVVSRAELLDRAGEVLDRVRDGRLSVRVGGRYALDDARRAHEDLEGRRSTGKLLVLPR
jgi:NADPH:quinone reductase